MTILEYKNLTDKFITIQNEWILLRLFLSHTPLLGLFPFMDSSTKTTDLNRNNIYYPRVEGMSLDFLALNICGFAFYSLYSTIGFFFH